MKALEAVKLLEQGKFITYKDNPVDGLYFKLVDGDIVNNNGDKVYSLLLNTEYVEYVVDNRKEWPEGLEQWKEVYNLLREDRFYYCDGLRCAPCPFKLENENITEHGCFSVAVKDYFEKLNKKYKLDK